MARILFSKIEWFMTSRKFVISFCIVGIVIAIAALSFAVYMMHIS